MNVRRGTRRSAEDTANRSSNERFSDKLRPLFVGGCQRSGTTAFADYLNEHEEIMMCQERYKRIAREKVTPELFTFERILDYRPGETNKPWNLDYYVQRHAEIIARKDPARLRWIGDKNPGNVKTMDVLLENNPGARFIMLYRPVEEVAESWDARAKNPDDHWLSGKDGFRLGVEAWNKAMISLREFIETSLIPRVLIVSYNDFFHDNERCTPLLSRFLEIELDDSVRASWAEMSRRFEESRRDKEPPTPEQARLIREHADREAEAWVLDRIERQWREPGLYAREDGRASLAALDEMEAKAWRLMRQRQELENDLQLERRTAQRSKKQSQSLGEQLQTIRGSKTWRLMDTLNRARLRAFGKRGSAR